MLMDTKWQAQMGYAKLTSRSAIVVKGKDATPFLQGQLTLDLGKVTTTQSQLAAHCNLKGRMQALFRVIQINSSEPEYLLLAPKELVPIAIKNLKKYAIFSKVSLHELDEMTICGLAGELAADTLAAFLEDDAVKTLSNGGCITQSHPDGLILVCKIPGKLPRFEMIVANARMADVQPFFSQSTTLTESSWESLDIEAGLPTIYPNTVDTLLPHHVNLMELGGISLDKGCYLGQEIVARMHYRGKIKRHMYLASLASNDEPACAGDQVVIVGAPNEAPGIVVRASQTEHGFILLVVLDEQYDNFENIRFKKADGPKLHRLNLIY